MGYSQYISGHIENAAWVLKKKSFLADSDLMIESGLADSTSGSIDILKLIS